MKQHLLGKQLKELSYEHRMTLLSLVIGLNRDYLIEEYSKTINNEDAALRGYGANVNIGAMMEIITSYTRQFPIPTFEKEEFTIAIEWKTSSGLEDSSLSGVQSSYCDALYEIIKDLFSKGYIEQK